MLHLDDLMAFRDPFKVFEPVSKAKHLSLKYSGNTMPDKALRDGILHFSRS